MEKIELIQALNYIEKEILALDKLKPSGISYFVKVTFSKVYAIAILKILLKLTHIAATGYVNP